MSLFLLVLSMALLIVVAIVTIAALYWLRKKKRISDAIPAEEGECQNVLVHIATSHFNDSLKVTMFLQLCFPQELVLQAHKKQFTMLIMFFMLFPQLLLRKCLK